MKKLSFKAKVALWEDSKTALRAKALNISATFKIIEMTEAALVAGDTEPDDGEARDVTSANFGYAAAHAQQALPSEAEERAYKKGCADTLHDLTPQAQPLTDEMIEAEAERRVSYGDPAQSLEEHRAEIRDVVKWARDRMAQQAQPLVGEHDHINDPHSDCAGCRGAQQIQPDCAKTTCALYEGQYHADNCEAGLTNDKV